MLLLTSDQVTPLLKSAAPGATVHLIGAGGCGMSGLGHLLLDLGLGVTGSDLVANDDTRALQERGAHIHLGHDSVHLAATRPLLVRLFLGRAPEQSRIASRRAVANSQRPPRVLLAALVHRQRGICVAGMHGKTTTSALLAFALENLSAHPSYAVGARVPQLTRHARLAQSSTGVPALLCRGGR